MNTSASEVSTWKLLFSFDAESHVREAAEDVPNYMGMGSDVFKIAILVEFVIFLMKGQPIHIYYAFSSTTSDIMLQVSSVLMKPVIFIVFCWLYHNYRLVTLPWNSTLSWFLVLILVDFMYYWMHRYSHEHSFFWATHQVHHSGEDFSFSTALRQGFLQHHFGTLFYLPLAFAVQPSLFIFHERFSKFYQFWLHTKLIRKLGPLEYVLNTPSHHRVHHGRNPYCIDKNYGGILIIWDRLFGTYAAEEEEVAYGLVHVQSSSNWIWLQASHYVTLFNRACKMNNNKDRVLLFWYKPSWKAESEKKGLSPEDLRVPEVEHPIRPRDLKEQGVGLLIYVLVHAVLFIQPLAQALCIHRVILWLLNLALMLGQGPELSRCEFWMLFFFICFGSTSLGFILDKKWYAYCTELFRCAIFLLTQQIISFENVRVLGIYTSLNLSLYVHVLSMIFMALCLYRGDPAADRASEAQKDDVETRCSNKKMQ